MNNDINVNIISWFNFEFDVSSFWFKYHLFVCLKLYLINKHFTKTIYIYIFFIKMVEKQGMNRISKNPALLQNSSTVKHS